MAKATPAQIAQYALVAFPGTGVDTDALKKAVAIALAESDGETGVVSPTNSDGSVDTGLWQINSIHKRDHPQWTVPWLQNPSNNATAMATLSNNGKNWRPWVAYKNGSYLAHMITASEAVGSITKDATGSIITDALEGLPLVGDTIEIAETAAKTVAAITTWIVNPDNWIRVVQVIGGVGLVLIASAIIIAPVVQKAR